MKCVRVKATKEIKRITDDEAKKLVGSGKAVYVSKSKWKAETR